MFFERNWNQCMKADWIDYFSNLGFFKDGTADRAWSHDM